VGAPGTQGNLSALGGEVRVAIVHDWLVEVGGAEKVLGELLKVFPNAAVFALLDVIPREERAFLRGRPVATSFLQKIPGVKKLYRALLPLVPLAVEHLDVSDYDLVISSSHAAAKGVITGPGQLHLCYCHSPIRYAWDMQELYLRQTGRSRGIAGFLARGLLHYIRIWDTRTPNGVDGFASNSSFVAKRVWKVYRRKCRVIYPPVEPIEGDGKKSGQGYYVSLGRLVPYKRVDLLVEAFRQMPDRELHIIGDGPERGNLERERPPNVHFLGRLSHDQKVEELSGARALLFPGEEDFGLVPVEAQSAGVPVVAYARGGAAETVVHGRTGILFQEQTVAALKHAIFALEAQSFDPAALREQADRFAPAVFRKRILSWVESEWSRFKRGTGGWLA
jgi:glycosyltransferase involved in cell wall biosynthesis